MKPLSEMRLMHIDQLDLNLLRLFDVVHRMRSVSGAATALGLSQPAASQGLARLRLAVGDALFVRAPGGVRPTPRAERLAPVVQSAIASLELALDEDRHFDAGRSNHVLKLHLSDIGEARFLPELMAALRHEAPGVQVESAPWPHEAIADALDNGTIDAAIGFLPAVRGTRSLELLRDRYVLLLRSAHPALKGRANRLGAGALHRLDYVAVRSHSETLRILQQLGLQDRLRLTSSNFLALPAIVRVTDLGVVMPYEIARTFAMFEGYSVVETALPQSGFGVSLHWSRRFEHTPVNRWQRELLTRLFKRPAERQSAAGSASGSAGGSAGGSASPRRAIRSSSAR